MKKIRLAAICMTLIFSFLGTNVYAMDEIDTEVFAPSTLYIIDEEQVEAEHIRQLQLKIAELGLTEGEYIICSGDVSPLNDISDYKTEYSATKYDTVSGYAGNQPTNGTYIAYGGAIHYDPDNGGESMSISVNFDTKFGSVSFNVPIGSKTSGVTGYSADVPAGGYWKLYVSKTYSVRAYIIYKKVWIDDFTGYQWQKFSSGSTNSLYSLNLTPIRMNN